MEIILFLIIITLLVNSGDRKAREFGEQLAAGVVTAVGLCIAGIVLFLGFEFAPTLTLWLLATAAVAAVALLIRWIYKRFFSPQARLNAAYERMHKRWYALSWHVVTIEHNHYAPQDVSSAVEKGERILARCREEHALYSKLPPETERPYRTQFYIDDIPRLEARLHKFSAAK